MQQSAADEVPDAPMLPVFVPMSEVHWPVSTCSLIYDYFSISPQLSNRQGGPLEKSEDHRLYESYDLMICRILCCTVSAPESPAEYVCTTGR